MQLLFDSENNTIVIHDNFYIKNRVSIQTVVSWLKDKFPRYMSYRGELKSSEVVDIVEKESVNKIFLEQFLK